MRKRLSIASLKTKAWRYFSRYVRLSNADYHGMCRCVTCGNRHHYKETQAGHYIHGNTKPTYFDERNVHCQCVKCNHHMGGNAVPYALFLENKYGVGILQELSIKATSGSGFKRDELEKIAEEYKQKCKVVED